MNLEEKIEQLMKIIAKDDELIQKLVDALNQKEAELKCLKQQIKKSGIK